MNNDDRQQQDIHIKQLDVDVIQDVMDTSSGCCLLVWYDGCCNEAVTGRGQGHVLPY